MRELYGEFARADGLVLPNQITAVFASQILGTAIFSDELEMYLGLGDAVPAQILTEADSEEPTIGVGGYARIRLGVDKWNVPDYNADQAVLISKPAVFTATGAGFSHTIRRPMIFSSQTRQPTVKMLSVGSPLPEPLLITPTTPIEQRTFVYRLYLR